MSVRSVLSVVALLWACTTFSPVLAGATDDPAEFIADLGNRTIAVLTSHLPKEERASTFQRLFDDNFDVPAIARFVLGAYWRTASEEQRQEFTKLFDTYIVRVYLVRFGEYTGERLKIMETRTLGENSSLVLTQIFRPGTAPPIHVDWRVDRTGTGLKITDVIVEGISMAIVERQEFASVIQRGGRQIEALFKLLRERIGES
jgi:phospholipid transport system substrate-binding protein